MQEKTLHDHIQHHALEQDIGPKNRERLVYTWRKIPTTSKSKQPIRNELVIYANSWMKMEIGPKTNIFYETM